MIEEWLKFTRLEFKTSNSAKNDIFWPLKFTKVWFHVKCYWQANRKVSAVCCLNFTFWMFLEHSVRAVFGYFLSFQIFYRMSESFSEKNLLNHIHLKVCNSTHPNIFSTRIVLGAVDSTLCNTFYLCVLRAPLNRINVKMNCASQQKIQVQFTMIHSALELW